MNESRFFCANGGKGSLSQVFLCKWWEPILASVSEVFLCKTKMAESKMSRTHDGRIQDGCHHQVEWEWMSLSQIKLAWVRLRVEWECFWVNLREDIKVSTSKMAVSESNIAEFEMAAIIKLSQNQWVKIFFCAKWWGGKWEWRFLWWKWWEPILANVSEFQRKN